MDEALEDLAAVRRGRVPSVPAGVRPRRLVGWASLVVAGMAIAAGAAAGTADAPAAQHHRSTFQHVTLKTNDAMRFVPDRIVVRPGTVVITMRNVGTLPHNLDIPHFHVTSKTILGGESTTVVLQATKPGTYPFDCDFHISEGMVGTLVITDAQRKGGRR